MLTLSDILVSAHMESAGFVLIDLASDANVVFDGTHRICLHYVLSGKVVINIDDAAHVLHAGDFVCLRRSGRHFLTGEVAGDGQRTNFLRTLTPSDELDRMRFGSAQAAHMAELLSGSFRLNWDDGAPVHAVMPDVMVLRPDGAVTGSFIPPPMVGAACRGIGAGAFAETLMHTLFVQAVRADVHGRLGQQAADFSNFQDYSSLQHYKIAAALRLIDRDYAQAWTVAKIANRVGMSSSGFARKFQAAVGVSPMARLGAVRLAEARRQLGKGVAVRTVARAVGYRSATAFSRAFHRRYGETPTTIGAA